MLKPSNFLYVPVKDGKWLRDSQGKPRMYKSVGRAIKNLKTHEYDSVHIYMIDDEVSREAFEEGCVEALKFTPTADVEEMKHGEWLRTGWNTYKCSNCGRIFVGMGAGDWNGCPNCLTKMDRVNHLATIPTIDDKE